VESGFLGQTETVCPEIMLKQRDRAHPDFIGMEPALEILQLAGTLVEEA